MALTTYKQWLQKESSALTRLRTDSANGLKPPIADFNSHSSPPPAEKEKLEKNLKKSHKKKKKDD